MYRNFDPQFHVAFIGWGPLVGAVKKMAEVNPRVHYKEPVEHELLVDYLREADLGFCLIENISLSDYYSLPNKLFEYIFSETPVVSFNLPSMSKIIKEKMLGEIVDDNPSDILNKIGTIFNNKYDFSDQNIKELTWSHQEVKLQNAYTALIKVGKYDET